jgi:rSAM/selenodomain-associated transferase 2
MRAPVSVIIPTLDAGAALPGCLGALGEGLAEGLIRELVVSDGGSRDGTLAVAAASGAVLVTGPAGRGGQLRRGVAAAQGAWLLVLHADTRLAPGWAAAVRGHLASDRAGYFRLSFDAEGLAPRIVAGWANLRSGLFGLPYGDQGLLVPRALYDVVEGYRDQPLMEDVEIARALRGRLVGLPAAAVTSAAKYLAQGWLRRGARNLWTFARYRAGVSAERLAAEYRR